MTKEEKQDKTDLIKAELSRVSSISALENMEGGQILIKKIMSDVVSVVDTLRLKYRVLTMQDFTSLCAEMDSKLDLVKTIKKSTKSKKQAQEDLKLALLEPEE